MNLYIGYGIMHHASYVLIFKEYTRTSRLGGVNDLSYDY
jgi:formate hydrogenlyase subunit 3/multisubunit Na+/H+ antiporter MnhD subunit